jgi:hypothetical protein
MSRVGLYVGLGILAALLLISGHSASQPPSLVTFTESATQCRPSQLTLVGGRQGGGFVGVALAVAVVSNKGPGICTLSGYPRIEMLSQRGDALRVSQPATPPAPKRNSIVLGQGQGVFITFQWTNWCQANPGPLRVRLRLQGYRNGVTGSFDGPPFYDFVPACQNASQPSTLTVVSPFRRDSSISSL